jgi:ectoine hydroxylase-related dioxygenase (phytanoyl-CoA dioxygenase family)
MPDFKLQQAREQYLADGYYISEGSIVPTPILEKAIAGMCAVRDGEFDTGIAVVDHPGYDPGKLCKINNAHTSNLALHALVNCDAIALLGAALTGSKMLQVWASQLLIKPPGSATGGNVGWHQDRQYWGFWQGEEGLFTLWIALGEVAHDSGPMRFVRGSHRWGFLNEGNFFDRDNETLKENIQSVSGEGWEEVEAVLPPGGVSVHNCLVYHGSGANVSDQPRCCLAVHVRNEKTAPAPGRDSYYLSHLDEDLYCPVIYGAE